MKKLLPVEVKSTPRPSGKDLRSMDLFLDTYANASFGIVVCTCQRPRALSARILALPITWLYVLTH